MFGACGMKAFVQPDKVTVDPNSNLRWCTTRNPRNEAVVKSSSSAFVGSFGGLRMILL